MTLSRFIDKYKRIIPEEDIEEFLIDATDLLRAIDENSYQRAVVEIGSEVAPIVVTKDYISFGSDLTSCLRLTFSEAVGIQPSDWRYLLRQVFYMANQHQTRHDEKRS